MIKYIAEIWWENYSPATWTLSNGNQIPWLRYGEWLLTCPVILIALSRIGTADGTYSKRTMQLLTSDQGTIIMGVTAALSSREVKVIFFLCGLCYGFNTFYTAAAVYLEAWKSVPDDNKDLVKVMAYCFYSSWIMFPILFILGPEGAGHITHDGSIIGHTVADLLSKNLWGIMDWWLDYQLKMRMEAELDDEDDGTNSETSFHKGKGSASGNSEMAANEPSKVAVMDGNGQVTQFFQQQLASAPANIMQVVSVEDAIARDAQIVIVPATMCTPETVERLRGANASVLALAQQGEARPADVDDVVMFPAFGQAYDPEPLLATFYALRGTTKNSKAGSESAGDGGANAEVLALVNSLKAEVQRLRSEVNSNSSGGPGTPSKMPAYAGSAGHNMV